MSQICLQFVLTISLMVVFDKKNKSFMHISRSQPLFFKENRNLWWAFSNELITLQGSYHDKENNISNFGLIGFLGIWNAFKVKMYYRILFICDMIDSVAFDDILANYLQFFAVYFRIYWKGSGQEYHNAEQV